LWGLHKIVAGAGKKAEMEETRGQRKRHQQVRDKRGSGKIGGVLGNDELGSTTAQNKV